MSKLSNFIKKVFTFKTIVILLLIVFQFHNYFMNANLKSQIEDVEDTCLDAPYDAADNVIDEIYSVRDNVEQAKSYAEEAAYYAERTYRLCD